MEIQKAGLFRFYLDYNSSHATQKKTGFIFFGNGDPERKFTIEMQQFCRIVTEKSGIEIKVIKLNGRPEQISHKINCFEFTATRYFSFHFRRTVMAIQHSI